MTTAHHELSGLVSKLHAGITEIEQIFESAFAIAEPQIISYLTQLLNSISVTKLVSEVTVAIPGFSPEIAQVIVSTVLTSVKTEVASNSAAAVLTATAKP
jgi:hypothetical protein